MSTLPSRAGVLFSLLVLGCSGCTAIANVGAYVTDLGCDLDVQFRSFGAWSTTGDPMILNLEVPNKGSMEQPWALTSVLVLDPIPAPNFDVHVPLGMTSELGHVDFFVDVNRDGAYQPKNAANQRIEPGWLIASTCPGAPIPFQSTEPFYDFDAPPSLGSDMRIALGGFVPNAGPVEVLVWVDHPYLGERPLALYRTTQTSATGTIDATILGVMPSAGLLRVDVWVDTDDDGDVSPWPMDQAFRTELDLTTTPTTVLAITPPSSVPSTGVVAHSGHRVVSIAN